jgi:hypothetical protein
VVETACATGLFARAGMSPEGKQQAIAMLRNMGHRVLMVGDGLNDGPALAAADASIAPGSASDVGRQAADFVFMGESLLALPRAVAGARATMCGASELCAGHRLQCLGGASGDFWLCHAVGGGHRHVDIFADRHRQFAAAGAARPLEPGGGGMTGLAFLIPVALLMGMGGLWAFSGLCARASSRIWTVRPPAS